MHDERGDVKEVYRVSTAGEKSLSPTCDGQLASFEIQYAAEYWVLNLKGGGGDREGG